MAAERERQLSRHRRRCPQSTEIEASEQIAALVKELYD
jgi:hypothetical protein